MSNLLDKASIILTPTAYNNGEALCVKPSDASGDFQFSRNSAATRVNAQGLVENVQILSSNLVQNGDFSEEGVQEVSNGSFSQEGVQLITNGNDTSNIVGLSDNQNINIQTSFLTIGKTYKIDFEIYDYVEGSIFLLRPNDLGVGSAVSANGTYTYTVVADASTGLIFRTDGLSTTLKLRNISVREVGQDWTLGGEVTIGDNLAHFESNTNTYSYIRQDISSLTTKTYKIQLEVKNYVSGAVQVAFSGASPIAQNLNVSTDGVYTAYLTPNANGDDFEVSREFNGGNFNFDITNISVKEVGQNWAFTSGATLTDIGAKITHTPTAGSIAQTSVLTIGNLYKLTYEITEKITGGLKFNSAVNTTMITSVGVHTKYFEADGTTAVIGRTSSTDNDVTITNLSVIEITDDTNLPRINYEGFSYQDAFGSEEIVNGDFSNGSTDWQTEGFSSIVVGDFKGKTDVAKININNTSTGSRIRQPFNYVSGKTYKVDIEVYVQSGNFRADSSDSFVSGDFVSTSTLGSWQTLTANVTAISTGSNYIWLRSISSVSEFYVSNVSVKEYLGQEVVPNSGCGSWLWESQTTQNVIYSEDFSQWTTSGDTTIESGYLAPDGTNNAYKVSGTNGILALTGTINTTSTRTIYARTVSGTGQAHLCSISSNTNNLFTITEQWQRFEVNSAIATGASNFYAVDFRNLTNLSEIILWGANATNDQDYATSYIPTEGSTVTRNQDLCTNGGSLASINSTEGTLYAEIAALADDGTLRRLSLSDGTNNNRVLIGYNAANTIQFVIQSLGAISVNQTFTLTDITQFSKIAFKYKENDCSFWIDGVKVGTDTIAAMPIGLNQALFAQGFTNEPFFGNTKALAVFPYLSDAELTELTTI